MDRISIIEKLENLPREYYQKALRAEDLSVLYRKAEAQYELAKAGNYLSFKADKDKKRTIDDLKALVTNAEAVQELNMKMIMSESDWKKARLEATDIMNQIDAVKELASFERITMKKLEQ